MISSLHYVIENCKQRTISDDDKQHHIFLKSTDDLEEMKINETFYLNFTAQPKAGIGGLYGNFSVLIIDEKCFLAKKKTFLI